MNKCFKSILVAVMITIGLASCTPPQYVQEIYDNQYKPLNLIPEYGSPYMQKTDAQKKADKEFIKSVVANSGSREKGAYEFAAWGWAEKRKGNMDNAMRRFNQSWLLDPNYYQPYWGFGGINNANRKHEKAIGFYEKALNLIDDNHEKPRLLVDTARAYFGQSYKLKKTDPTKSETYFRKGSALIETALNVDPKYGKAYYVGGLFYLDHGEYRKAWDIVKKARVSGNYHFDPKFIDALSEKMPEPK